MNKSKKNIILVHGAWHGGWCRDKIKDNTLFSDHNIFAPTLFGMNGRDDQHSKSTGLHKHIKQIENIILENKLEEVILLGHSYAGMIITEVANNLPDHISKLIYLDAFIPNDGESLFDLCDPSSVNTMMSLLTDTDKKTSEQGAKDPWLIPVRDPKYFGVYEADDITFLSERMVPMPVSCFSEKVRLNEETSEDILKYFIKCTATSISKYVDKENLEDSFTYFEIDAGHDIMISDPQKLIKILREIIR